MHSRAPFNSGRLSSRDAAAEELQIFEPNNL